MSKMPSFSLKTGEPIPRFSREASATCSSLLSEAAFRNRFSFFNSEFQPINAEWVYFCTSIELKFLRKQLLQRASTERFKALVPKAHKSECQNLLFPL